LQPPLPADQQAALAAIPGWFWEEWQRVPWEQRCREVAAFVEEHGRLPRSEAGKAEPLLPGEKVFGSWCKTQRQRWKGKKQPPLSAEQQAALAAIPGWLWEERESVPWEQRCREVAASVEEHGRLPRSTAGSTEPFLPGERALGLWCNDQRQRWKGKKQPGLTSTQKAALAAIPGWLWEERVRVPWEQRFLEVAAFVEEHGRLPRSEAGKAEPLLPGEKELGIWCLHQRQRWKGQKKSALTIEQQTALAAIPGWLWEEFRVVPWEQRCREVAAFVEEHGRLPRKEGRNAKPLLPGEKELGKWCVTQRQRLKGKVQPPLSAEQQAALSAIPGWVWESYPPWEQQRLAVEAFVREHGRLPRQKARKAQPLQPWEKQLGQWCGRQRQRWKGNGAAAPLSAEQVAALEAILYWRW
jgi:hypothetical protein